MIAMETNIKAQEVIAEVYKVNSDNIPTLYACVPKIDSAETQSIGWKMAYGFRSLHGGIWIWAEDQLVTNLLLKDGDIQKTLSDFWKRQDDDFGRVHSIVANPAWQPSTLTIAEFIASGLVVTHHWDIQKLLKKYNTSIPKARIEREYYVRGWDMKGIPVVSISTSSSIKSTIDFAKHARELQGDNLSRVLGLFVQDKTSTMKGEIIGVVGKLSNHKARLLQLTRRQKMIDAINHAPDQDLVVKIASGNNEYDYITSVLEIVIRTQDYQRLQIDGSKALRALQIEPDLRFNIVQEVANLLAQENYIFSDPLAATDEHSRFTTANSIGFIPSVRLGDNHVCEADARIILSELRTHPIYRRSPNFVGNAPIRIGIINFMGNDDRIRKYLSSIRNELNRIKFNVEFTAAERPAENSQYETEQAVDRLNRQVPHMIIVFASGSPSESEDDETDLYHTLKSYLIGHNIQSQFIYESTLDKSYALSNIVLGIIAKTGNVPYVLEQALPYADIVAGIDVARLATQRRSGSLSVPAITRVYTSEGDFLRYILSEGPIEGETLPRATIRKLFPAHLFANRRVLIHRDGPFRGNEMDELYQWGEEIGTDFMLVEVIKSGAPRLYSKEQTIQRPSKGDALILNEREAFLVSSLPPHKNSTPRPLHVKTDGKITIEQALHSILSLTVVHYGSVLQPRLPVTIHYSDRIGYLALQGIRPQNGEGNQPYWL
jgi:hypothetical protein